METRKVTVRCVPYEMSIVDGGVLFSNKSGFFGVSARIMFEQRQGLWYISNAATTLDGVALCHLVKMSQLLEKHIVRSPPLGKLQFKCGWDDGE